VRIFPPCSMRVLLCCSLLSSAAAFTILPARTSQQRRLGACSVRPTMGLFDAFAKAFDNKDYSDSPATYEQTNARASHVLVDDKAKAEEIKAKIDAGEITFDEAAVQFSTCSSSSRGGRLGKFTPGAMAPEFDAIVFDVYDTGEINAGNGAFIYEPKYEVGVVHGPVQTKFGYHLILIEKRTIADFDFRAKEGQLPKANVWEDSQL